VIGSQRRALKPAALFSNASSCFPTAVAAVPITLQALDTLSSCGGPRQIMVHPMAAMIRTAECIHGFSRRDRVLANDTTKKIANR